MNITTFHWKIKTTSKHPKLNFIWDKATIKWIKKNKKEKPTLTISRIDHKSLIGNEYLCLIGEEIVELTPWSVKIKAYGYMEDNQKFDILVEGEF